MTDVITTKTQTGLEQIELDLAGYSWIGLDWAGLGLIRVNQTRLDWIELVYIGWDRIGIDWT